MEPSAAACAGAPPETSSSGGAGGAAAAEGPRQRLAEAVRDMVVASMICGSKHEITLSAMSELGAVMAQQGHFREAEKVFKNVLETTKKILCSDHHDTLGSMNNLAIVLQKQGKWQEAEQLHRDTLEAMKKILCPDHQDTQDTLRSMNNLANVLQKQGKWQEAEQLYRDALEAMKKILRPDHQDTLSSMNNLANVLQKQCKWQEAEQLHRDVLKARKKILCPDHQDTQDTLGSMSGLANVLQMQGKWQEAEQLHRDVLKARKKILRPDHHDTLSSMNNLACVLQEQGKWQEAEQLHRHVLKARQKTLGPHHPGTLGSMSTLGAAMIQRGREDGQFRAEQQLKDRSFQQKRVEEGLQLIRAAMKRSEGRMASDHPDQLWRRREAAMLLAQFGKRDDLELAARELLDLLPALFVSFKPSSGVEGSKSREAVQTLISLLDELGRSEAVEKLRQLIVEIRGPAETEASTAADSGESLPAEDVPSASEASTEETAWREGEMMRWKMKLEEDRDKVTKEAEFHAKGLPCNLWSSQDGSSSHVPDLRSESNLPPSSSNDIRLEQASHSQMSQTQSEYLRRAEAFLESSEAGTEEIQQEI